VSQLNRKIRAELDLLATQQILSAAQVAQLAERYPTAPWDLVSLARWLTLVGAVAAGAGVVLLGTQLAMWRTLLEVVLLGAAAGLCWLGRWLGRARGMTRTQAALELLGAFALQGLTVALAVHYSSGSDNWPALVGVDTLCAAALAYALGNRLILILALINLFMFFGGETGYVSGWGMYWLGMTYPVRFVAAGLMSLGAGWAHARFAPPRWRGFSRVYLHFGLLITNLALWFLALFGFFEEHVRWEGNESERVIFSVVWAATSIGSLWASGRLGLSTLRAYGLTFLIINVYTFYFQFVVASSPSLWFLHLLLSGGSLVVLALRVERLRRPPAADPAADPS
jgi:hypothetical protein